MASANNTVIRAGQTLTDGAGNVWGIAPDGLITVNGQEDQTTAGVVQMAYVDGLVWQENKDALWWEKSTPSDTWAPGPAPVSIVPQARTWIGSTSNDSTDPAAWSPAGAPLPGDTLTMATGTMTLRGDDLAGNPLRIIATQAMATPVINEAGDANLILKTVTRAGTGAAVIVNVTGTDRLAIQGDSSFSMGETIHLADNAHLVMDSSWSTMSFLDVSGPASATLELDEKLVMTASKAVFDTHLSGAGTIAVRAYSSVFSTLELVGAVDQDVHVDVSGDPVKNSGGRVSIDHPDSFHGAINLTEGFVGFKGLHADSYDLRNGFLDLFNLGQVVGHYQFTTSGQEQNPQIAPIHVVQNSFGVVVGNGSGVGGLGDSGQPLSLHS